MAVPDEMMGEKVGAVIVPAAGAELDVEAVIAHCRSHLADFKVPQYVATRTEPLPPDSPLLGLDRVVLTPHVGGAVVNNFPRVIRRAYDNVRRVLDGDRAGVAPADVVVWPGEGERR